MKTIVFYLSTTLFAVLLGVIIGVDRPLDMLRTAVNVTGDAVVSVIVDGT